MKKDLDIRAMELRAVLDEVEWKTGTAWVTEYQFAPPRRWRFDAASVDRKLAVEVEGAVWSYGRHTRASGFMLDKEKYNRAAELGWRLLRFTWPEIRDGSATTQIIATLGGCDHDS